MPHGFPWVSMNSCCPNDHPTTAQGSPGVVGGHPKITILQPTHNGHKMAKSSPVGPHVGLDLGKLEMALETPVIE